MTKPAIILAKESKYLYVLMALCLVLVGLYMYCVSASIVHVVVRKEALRNVGALESEIAKLEANYIALQHNVSSDVASLSGYVAVTDKIFLRRGEAVVLSYSTQ